MYMPHRTPAATTRYLFLVAWVLLVLLPLVPLLIWSGAFAWRWPDVLPGSWSLRAWRYVFAPTTGARPALVSSVLIALAVTTLAVAFGTPAGLALARARFRGQRAAELLLLAPFFVPGLVTAMGVQIAFIRLGLADTIPGVVLAHLMPALPYVVVSVRGVAANLGPQPEEQARSLGASPWRAFRHVTLPALRPGMIVGGLFAFLVSWSQYTTTLVIGGGAVQTLPLVVYAFQRSGENAIAAALAVVFVAPAILALAIAARSLSGRPGVGGRV